MALNGIKKKMMDWVCKITLTPFMRHIQRVARLLSAVLLELTFRYERQMIILLAKMYKTTHFVILEVRTGRGQRLPELKNAVCDEKYFHSLTVNCHSLNTPNTFIWV